ncbi:MAG: hypothetical protein QOI13_2590 [Paraburkholderia sp.]|nr:hypothetical protein [Paraburkholderia sp.]
MVKPLPIFRPFTGTIELLYRLNLFVQLPFFVAEFLLYLTGYFLVTDECGGYALVIDRVTVVKAPGRQRKDTKPARVRKLVCIANALQHAPFR